MPKSRDVAIFVPTTDDDRQQTKPIALPLAHVRGVIILSKQLECLEQALNSVVTIIGCMSNYANKDIKVPPCLLFIPQ